MLGWMLKRGETAANAPDEDNTLADIPDTPAPVFAARAFKSAIFGAQPREAPRSRQPRIAAAPEGSQTPPAKPQGILLTPGTGANRQKRVSFGRDVKNTQGSTEPKAHETKRTRLNEALEKARQKKVAATNKRTTTAAASDPPAPSSQTNVPDDDDWEEEGNSSADEENLCHHDITLDLNEPHSSSGRYWKEEFEKYHQEAKAELAKLLKYKQLAKSYAQQKDAEAVELAEKLRDEQAKVISMEQLIAENASEIVSKHTNAEEASAEMVQKLSKETALAGQYRERVQELEDQLEDFLQDKEDDNGEKARRRKQVGLSPRAQKTLLETQRELQKARLQAKETNSLREQVLSLKEQLKAAEKRASKAETESRDKESESTRTKDLRDQLRELKAENREKDRELAKLKAEFEQYRQDTQHHDDDSKAVLERAHAKIAELKKELRAAKSANSDHGKAQTKALTEKDSAPNHAVASATDTLHTTATSRRNHRTLDKRPTSGSPRKASAESQRTLRDQFHEDGDDVAEPKMSGALGERPDLERPKWQPFVPRSPRNRGYLGEDVAKRLEHGGVTPTAVRTSSNMDADLSALANATSRAGRDTRQDEVTETLDLKSRMVQLDHPELQRHKSAKLDPKATEDAGKSKLPPDRRAAAMAKIEQRRAEKLRARARMGGNDKENVVPS
ncbi:uncharacterized protein J7T54_008177 [Emericellopsis cladophorae]|uniref:Spindle pole body-associated protein cut12 domain-containing protein n=1 Tax=Emericellopsis cladophorae TaxID=2686198 RepID=A0A9P9Y7J4_9HYPO|nr:uncharacterized protein J7T54_008177 [Emericellopsis cladophorae]KAI6785083.1 hypothetical protein J7T54_008177 [Emericellopsis cladophorae]